jgi:hypothetical protein
MKKRTVMRALVWAAAAAVACLLVTACTNPVADILNSKGWGLVGTWGNPAYTALPSIAHPGRLIYNADGSVKMSDPGGGSASTGTYTIGDVSVSGTVRTYQVTVNMTTPTYLLCRITDGKTYESMTGGLSYPTAINTMDPTYGTLTAQ